MLPKIIEAVWSHAPPGHKAAERNALRQLLTA
jgi:hypothetical protein